MGVKAQLYAALVEGTRQKGRGFLWIPVAFGAGVAAYFGLGVEPAAWAAAPALLLLLPVAAHLYGRQHGSLWHLLGYLAALGMTLAALGFAAAQVECWRIGTPILEKAIGPKTMTGYVESKEALGGKRGSRAVLSNLIIEDLEPAKTPRKIRLTFRKDEGLEAGSTVRALVRLDAPSQPVLPGAYDFRRHLFFQGIGGVGFSYTAPEIVDGAVPSGAALWFERLRVAIDERIKAQAGTASAGIMSALITGQRGAIAEGDDDAMRQSGLYHLLSISGTHVSLVAGIMFFAIRFLMALWPWMAIHWPIKKIAAAIALAGAGFYVMLAGADVPAVRSWMMTGLVMIAIMLDRSPVSLRLIAFSALAVLFFAPHALTGVSFQMSFAAVAALIAFGEYIRPWWMAWYRTGGFLRKPVMYLAAIAMTSVIAGVMTGLLSLYHFQSFAVYGVLSNMIVIPLTGAVIMPGAILAALAMPFGLEAWPLKAMEWGTEWMLAVAHWTAGLEGAVIHVAQWPFATLALMSVGSVIFVLWHGWRGKGVAALIVAAGLLLPVFGKPADVMVSATGKLAAVRGAGGALFFTTRRAERFTAENWLRLAGREGDAPRLLPSDPQSPARCDGEACRAVIWHGQNETKISLARTRKGALEDCAWADVVIAQVPLERSACKGPGAVLGLYDFLDRGAHAVRVDGKDVEIVSVRQTLGARPWSGGE